MYENFIGKNVVVGLKTTNKEFYGNLKIVLGKTLILGNEKGDTEIALDDIAYVRPFLR